MRTSYKQGKYVANYVWDVAAGTPEVLQESRKQIYTDDGTTIVTGLDVALLPGGSPSPVRYVYGVGLAASIDGSGQARYYFPDALGSTRAALAGAVKMDYSYEGFGLLRDGPAKDTFMFAGEQSDSRARQGATGLYYLRARYYDPSLGRFLTADPAQAGHRYVYADNNPVNRVDPTGLASEGGDLAGAFLEELIFQDCWKLIAVTALLVALAIGFCIPTGRGHCGSAWCSGSPRGILVFQRVRHGRRKSRRWLLSLRSVY